MLIRRVQGHVTGKGSPFEHGRKGMINLDPVLVQEPTGGPGFQFSFFRQVHIAPSRVLVEFVPFRFPVSQQDQGIHAIFAEIGQLEGRGSRIQGRPATDNVANHRIVAAVVVAAAPRSHVRPASS